MPTRIKTTLIKAMTIKATVKLPHRDAVDWQCEVTQVQPGKFLPRLEGLTTFLGMHATLDAAVQAALRASFGSPAVSDMKEAA